jgi:hypothetical protein
MATNIENKAFPTVVQLLATEYASYFIGGLDGIDRKRQDRLNAIEDKIVEMGIEWKDWSDLVMAHAKIVLGERN